MRVIIFTFFFIIILPFFLFSQEANQALKQADDLFDKMSDMETAQKALNLYRTSLNQTENKYEPFWKLSRLLYYIGEHTEDKKGKKNIFSQAVYYAEKAIQLEPEKPDGYYWRGVNNGKYGETRGVLKSLSLVKPIKNDMNKVIELDPEYEDGGAYRVLGRVYFKLPGFAGGSQEESLKLLKKSIEFGPNDANTRLFLGETLLNMKEIEKAREELEFVLSLENDPLWKSDVASAKKQAEELLQNKKFRKN
ncbi:MAG: tetratricopeptide repeat protein [Acidobacteriota bacterium]